MALFGGGGGTILAPLRGLAAALVGLGLGFSSVQITLPYAAGMRSFEVLSPVKPVVLAGESSEAVAAMGAGVRAALEAPLDGAPLSELCRGKKRALLAIEDGAGGLNLAEAVSATCQALIEAGIRPSRIHILVSSTLDRPVLGREVLDLVGEEVAGSYEVLGGRSDSISVEVSEGGRLDFDARLKAADLLLALGVVRPHYLFGFAGPWTLLCPGLCTRESLEKILSAENLTHPHVRAGLRKGNPVFNAAVAGAAALEPDLTVALVRTPQGGVSGVSAGRIATVVEQACPRSARAGTLGAPPEPAEAVIASAGGALWDERFEAFVAAADLAREFAVPGGELVIFGPCDRGLPDAAFGAALGLLAAGQEVPETPVAERWTLKRLQQILTRNNVTIISEGLRPEENDDEEEIPKRKLPPEGRLRGTEHDVWRSEATSILVLPYAAYHVCPSTGPKA